MIYWRWQGAFDTLFGMMLTALLWLLPSLGAPVLFIADAQSAPITARTWVGPILGLLGMMSATTAFIFSLVERAEPHFARRSASEAYLWNIFSENLLWFGIAAFVACGASFMTPPFSTSMMMGFTFILMMMGICISKFVWIMRKIISQRVARALANASAEGR